MTDTFEFTLDNPLTEEQWDMIADVDMERTDSVTFHTKHGKEVEFTKVVRCKDCKNHHEAHYEEDGEAPIIKHKCKLLKGYQFSENHYCGFAERKEHD